MEEVFLGILVDPQRDHIEHARVGDLLDTGESGLQRGQAEVVADQRVGGLPGDALDGRLRVIGLGGGAWLAAQIRQHILCRLRAVKNLFEEADGAGALGHRRRAPERKADACRGQVIGSLGKLGQ